MTLGQIYLEELQAEVPSTLKCLERITPEVFEYKPHDKSMKMGYLALIVAEVPKWIAYTLEKGDIDFATFTHTPCKNGEELAKHLDENMIWAKKLLEAVKDETLNEQFNLSAGGKIMLSMTKKEMISSSIRHWVHHRGQLTVYMRLNNIPVPSIYGPTADEKNF